MTNDLPDRRGEVYRRVGQGWTFKILEYVEDSEVCVFGVGNQGDGHRGRIDPTDLEDKIQTGEVARVS